MKNKLRFKSDKLAIIFLNISYVSFMLIFLYTIKNLIFRYRTLPYKDGIFGISGEGSTYILMALFTYLISIIVLFIILKIFDNEKK